jgi:hypothetical protein
MVHHDVFLPQVITESVSGEAWPADVLVPATNV